ncbi:MAG: sulfite exporter TauE/SafE family protein [Bacteroidales bacterium]|nr:sulfite exporter TauE/SafE family protein [Bacteroidales bacterium]
MLLTISIDLIKNADIYSPGIIALLILAGFMVGVINTIAGSGTVITYSLFMMLGLPVNFANGTIRLGVIMQTLASTLNFKKHNALDWKKGFKLALPVVIGSIVGAQIAVEINEAIFEKILAVILLVMLFFIFYKPERWLKNQVQKIQSKPTIVQLILFFIIGLYGGFIHIGVGIFMLSVLVLNAGYDLVKANAIKVMIVFLYSPFALAVFMMNDQVHYGIGLIAAIGNVFGGIVGSKMAINWGSNFVRWVLMVVIVVFSAYLLNIPEILRKI